MFSQTEDVCMFREHVSACTCNPRCVCSVSSSNTVSGFVTMGKISILAPQTFNFRFGCKTGLDLKLGLGFGSW